MRFIRDIHAEKEATGKPTISFEFFPFKTSEGEETFFGKTLPALMTARPDYASVTYGAGGSTREKTLEIVERIQNDFDLTTMAHLTCVRHTQAEIRGILDEAAKRGIQNILALRGAPLPARSGRRPRAASSTPRSWLHSSASGAESASVSPVSRRDTSIAQRAAMSTGGISSVKSTAVPT